MMKKWITGAMLVVLTMAVGCTSVVALAPSADAPEASKVEKSEVKKEKKEKKEKKMGKLTSLGRSTVRIDLKNGKTIYIDPFAGEETDYEKPADLLLVTHQHGDHNKIDKVTLKDSGQIIQCPTDIVAGDEIEAQGINITAVSAYNKNHPAEVNVGYILEVDGLTIYHSGDTSMTEQMPELAAFDIDYALVCMDGYYNMGPEEAMEVAEAIQAKHVIRAY